jgi:acetyl esterase/lipase
VAAQDYSKYYTVAHAKDFDIDWKSFYAKGTEATLALQKRLPHKLDLAYGRDPKQRLDLYMPVGTVRNAPVLLFMHGGGKREGDKSHYGYVAKPFAAKGIVTAVISYRLFSDDNGLKFPAQEADARNAVIWLYRNVARFGGNPQNIFLVGHSAGASLTSFLASDRSWLMSGGTYDFTTAKSPVNDSYFATAENKRRATPAFNVNDPAPDWIIHYGEKEGDAERLSGIEQLERALEAKGAKVQVVVEPAADHAEAVWALGDPATPTYQAVASMIDRNTRNSH